MLRRNHATPFQVDRETPYEKAVRRSLAVSRGWPQYECAVGLDAEEREFVASIGRLAGTDRDDERKLSVVIKDLIRKLMVHYAELMKEKQETSE
jgi:hypothetical protein